MSKKLVGWSLLHAVLAAAYIFGVVNLMNNGKKFFGELPEIFIGSIMLTLLVISASVMGILIFGRPVMLYIDNKKKESLIMLFCTVGWLAVFLILSLLTVILNKLYLKI